MSSIAVLGAGAMGSGICTPLIAAGWDVRLWGTWLDDHLLDAVEAGEPHPRTKVQLAKGPHLFRSGELDAALDGVDVVLIAVASVGVPKVTEMALDGMAKAKAVWMTSKGFSRDQSGKIQLLPDAVRRIALDNGVDLPPIVAIAGPVKANECADGKPTATIFGSLDDGVAAKWALEAATPVYAIEPSTDEVGVEICAPMKNVYAIALGIADGLEEATSDPHHNLKAATFARAIREMSMIGEALGARPETAYGLAGVGDLEVTGLSGRNKLYGVRIGRGEAAREALNEMDRLEQTVEGVPAAPLAVTLVQQRAGHLVDDMKLLNAVAAIIDGADDPVGLIVGAVLPAKGLRT